MPRLSFSYFRNLFNYSEYRLGTDGFSDGWIYAGKERERHMGKETLESMLELFANEWLKQIIISNPVSKEGGNPVIKEGGNPVIKEDDNLVIKEGGNPVIKEDGKADTIEGTKERIKKDSNKESKKENGKDGKRDGKEKPQKVKIRPMLLKGALVFQAEELVGTQAFHKNLQPQELKSYMRERLEHDFRQAEVLSELGNATVLVSKKGMMTVKVKRSGSLVGGDKKTGNQRDDKKAISQGAGSICRKDKAEDRSGKTGDQRTKAAIEKDKAAVQKDEAAIQKEKAAIQKDKAAVWKDEAAIRTNEAVIRTNEADYQPRMMPSPVLLQHNRQKRYVLQEGIPVPFLVDLGVMTADGTIVRTRYDKFRQINRFLEFIEDILPKLDKNKETTIIDFGCGKSYLTFAMYYYLHILKEYPIRVIGLDLKRDVIARCNQLADRYGYEKLKFYHGDIAEYEGVTQVDMVVTLHACDTATDYALAKAVRWGAKVILSVPCCQHELNHQIKNDLLKPVLQYGLIKERMAALYTDALRAELLESCGYRTQILEFIDMEHTPKNILIRAVYDGKPKNNLDGLQQIMEFLHADPTLWRLLKEQK